VGPAAVAGGDGVGDPEGKVPRTDGVRLRLQQQVQVLTAQVEPDGDEVERRRRWDFLEPEHVPVEPPAPFDVRDEHGDVIEVRDLH
jgi:hypothetical protein